MPHRLLLYDDSPVMSIGYMGIDGIFFVGLLSPAYIRCNAPRPPALPSSLICPQFPRCFRSSSLAARTRSRSGLLRPVRGRCVVSHAFPSYISMPLQATIIGLVAAVSGSPGVCRVRKTPANGRIRRVSRPGLGHALCNFQVLAACPTPDRFDNS